jgi:hypothetical protein
MSLPTLTHTPTSAPTQTPIFTVEPSPTLTLTSTVTSTATAVTIPTSTVAPTLTPVPSLPPSTVPPADNSAQPFAARSLFDGEPVPVSVPVNATALEAVDTVFTHALETAPASIWTAVMGSPANGWEVEFYDEANDIVLLYTVALDGEVRLLRTAAFGLMPGFPLARNRITVDSDRALQLAAADGSLPSGAIIMEMRSAGDAPAWSISGDDMLALVPATNE